MGKSRICMKTIASIALSVVLALGLLPAQAFAEVGDAVAATVPQAASIDMRDDASSAEPSIEPSIGSEGVDDLGESYSAESGENAFTPEEADEGNQASDSSFASPEGEEGIAPEAAEGSGFGTQAVNSYAVLYDSDGDGTGDKLVFQSSTLNLSKYGAKVSSWQFAAEQTKFTSSSPAPWYDARLTVKSAVFNNPLSPTSLAYWFYGMSSLEFVDFANLDTSSATDMSYMFSGCSSLASVDLSSFDTSKVTDMGAMFSGCSSLQSLDLSSFDTSKVRIMGGLNEESRGMFYGCSSLEAVYAGPGFTASAIGYVSRVDSNGAIHHSYYRCGMFSGCTSLKGGSGTAYSSSYTETARARIDAPGAPGYFTESCKPSEHTLVTIADEDKCELGGESEVITMCSVCGREFSHEIVNFTPGHINVIDPAVPATCLSTGLTEGLHCSRCGKVFLAQKVIPKTGHTVVADPRVEPTCVKDGLTAGSHCSACGQVLVAQEAVPAKGHTVVADAAVEPTCTETGLTEGSHCSVCGEVLEAQEAVPAKGHDWGEWKVVRPATADREGLKERVCARDSSHVETEAIKKLDRAPFPDVDYDSWYASGVTFVADKGLITGYAANGYFGVGDALTRGQLATILWRNACPDEAAAYDPAAARNETGLDGVSDGEYYTEAANWAVREGVITGFEREDGTHDFAASSSVSFEQLITILSRLCADPDEVAAAGSDLSPFVDGADADVWAAGALAWAAGKGLVTGYVEPDGKYLRPVEEVARERAATVLMRAFELGIMK